MHTIDKFIDELKRSSYQNSERLFNDACLLFSNGRYDSAVALAILSFEELGKLAIADRSADHMNLNEADPKEVMKTFYGSMANNHWLKQNWASFESMQFDTDISKRIQSGWLDETKLKALYIDISGSTVISPQTSKELALEVINLVFTAFPSFHDMAYSGFDGYTTAKSDWLSTEAFKRVQQTYQQYVAS